MKPESWEIVKETPTQRRQITDRGNQFSSHLFRLRHLLLHRSETFFNLAPLFSSTSSRTIRSLGHVINFDDCNNNDQTKRDFLHRRLESKKVRFSSPPARNCGGRIKNVYSALRAVKERSCANILKIAVFEPFKVRLLCIELHARAKEATKCPSTLSEFCRKKAQIKKIVNSSNFHVEELLMKRLFCFCPCS